MATRESHREELEALSRDLWESSWSLNLEWGDDAALRKAGLSGDCFANLIVGETPISMTTTQL